MTTPATTPETTAPPEGAGGVGLTLDPVTLDAFFDEHWDRAPLLLARGEAARFDSILSRDDVERVVCETGVRVPAFRLVKDGAQLPPGAYTRDVRWSPSSFSAMAVVERVAQEFADGATVVLQALHLNWHAAALYCRSLEIALGCPVQANAYLTPASARGFDVHHDTHDVFVLQVAGTKRWRWYEPVRELPLKDQKWAAEEAEVGAPVADVTLTPGDTLYLPRGWPHEAFTSDDDSLHLTIGVHPPTRLDALRAALDDCGDDVEFRRAFEAGGELPAHLVERLAARLRPEQVDARMRRRFVLGRKAILDDQLRQARRAAGLTAGDLVERRPTVISLFEPGPGAVTLLFEGKRVVFPAVAGDAVVAIDGFDVPFSAAQLPGPLDEPGRLVLLRRLVREGFLRIL